MANTKISDLTAGSAVVAGNLFPSVETAGVGPVKTTAAQLKTFMSASPTLVTPTLGVASGTSLALGGATIGSNALAVTGTSNIGGFAINGSGAATIPAAQYINWIGRGLIRSNADGAFSFSNNAESTITSVSIPTSATLQHGAADAAAPVAQTISFQSVVAGTSNTAGVNATVKASAGTGTGAGGSLIFQVAAAGSTGSTQNTFTTALTINSASQSVFSAGTAALPAVSFGDLDTGFYKPSASSVSLSISGSPTLAVFGSVIRMKGSIPFGFSSGDASTAADTGVSRVSAGVLGVGTGAAASIAGTLQAANYDLRPGTAIPAGGTAGFGFRATSTSNFGVFFGSGAPSLAAAKGSLYLRSDGSGVADRAYINTDGSTTWTNLVTGG